jgi:hypothetical protein
MGGSGSALLQRIGIVSEPIMAAVSRRHGNAGSDGAIE